MQAAQLIRMLRSNKTPPQLNAKYKFIQRLVSRCNELPLWPQNVITTKYLRRRRLENVSLVLSSAVQCSTLISVGHSLSS